jgi:type VI protein secretion system component VasK
MWLIAILVVAAILSVVGKKEHSHVVSWLSWAAFLCGIVVYLTWRRAALAERRARVFDREAKTDETGTRSDQ